MAVRQVMPPVHVSLAHHGTECQPGCALVPDGCKCKLDASFEDAIPAAAGDAGGPAQGGLIIAVDSGLSEELLH